jgi:hypothetical protein
VDPAVAGLVGAAIAASVGLASAALARRTEHEKWLREKRLEAYVAFLAAADELVMKTMLSHLIDEALRDAINEKVEQQLRVLPTTDKNTLTELHNQVAQNVRQTVDGTVAPPRQVVADALRPFKEVERSMALVKLVGPPELEVQLQAVKDLAFATGMAFAIGGKAKRSEDEVLKEFNNLVETFVRQARSYLHVKRLHPTSVFGSRNDSRPGGNAAPPPDP